MIKGKGAIVEVISVIVMELGRFDVSIRGMMLCISGGSLIFVGNIGNMSDREGLRLCVYASNSSLSLAT